MNKNFELDSKNIFNTINDMISESNGGKIVYKAFPMHECVDISTNPEHRYKSNLINAIYKIFKSIGYKVSLDGKTYDNIVYRTIEIDLDSKETNQRPELTMMSKKLTNYTDTTFNYIDVYIISEGAWVTSVIVKIGNSRDFEQTTKEENSIGEVKLFNTMLNFHNMGFDIIDIEEE